MFNPGNKVFLDASDVQTTHSSQKLSYQQLGLFVVEWQIRPVAYCLKLLHQVKQLHSVFNVMKLTLCEGNQGKVLQEISQINYTMKYVTTYLQEIPQRIR